MVKISLVCPYFQYSKNYTVLVQAKAEEQPDYDLKVECFQVLLCYVLGLFRVRVYFESLGPFLCTLQFLVSFSLLGRPLDPQNPWFHHFKGMKRNLRELMKSTF